MGAVTGTDQASTQSRRTSRSGCKEVVASRRDLGRKNGSSALSKRSTYRSKSWASRIDFRLLLVGLGMVAIAIDYLWHRHPRLVAPTNPIALETAPMADFPAIPDRPSLAVLPFQNASNDPDQDYFADGLVDDLITALSRIKWLFIIAKNSTYTYKGRPVDVRQIGRELGVRYVMQGSVRRASNQVRITGQLVEAESGRNTWADHFDAEYDDIFALQDHVTSSVAAAVEPNFHVFEIDRASKKPTTSLTACDFNLRAQPHLRISTGGFAIGERLLRDAIALDLQYSLAFTTKIQSSGIMAQTATSARAAPFLSHGRVT